ncbi:hypothetical protein R69746_07875 [Paraburkholderia aspalathi]|uniref:hypothetical protein n=1 Tax=Paraburkholderia aspalathi TaxID=1324617 RepID=UPI00190CE823|nr:hypothetical protein [Paraburkholderia aspalathi]MBK3843902.1 hypothetical protein [Paraburkholderia aspalathi]CAE6862145.1 hypothetical protein R69746_07875 [Paraburkholderia aspalathi]
MKRKSPLPHHLSRDISQIGLALRDCARQIRYAARNVPGSIKSDESISQWMPVSQRIKPPGQLSLDSVAHFADDLIETAETFAGHALPSLQDHWKVPVALEPLTGYLRVSGGYAKTLRIFSMGYYAAAKRMIIQSGASDVLIFEYLIGAAFERTSALLSVSETVQHLEPASDWNRSPHTLIRACAQLALSLIDSQPIRSTRFDTLPDTNAPWWLITEPNPYVFLTLSVSSLAKDLCPAGLDTEPDAVLRFFADVIGAREAAFRKALKGSDPLLALTAEIEHVVTHLC